MGIFSKRCIGVTNRREIWQSGGQTVIWWAWYTPLVNIGLTDLPNSGGRVWPPLAPTAPTALGVTNRIVTPLKCITIATITLAQSKMDEYAVLSPLRWIDMSRSQLGQNVYKNASLKCYEYPSIQFLEGIFSKFFNWSSIFEIFPKKPFNTSDLAHPIHQPIWNLNFTFFWLVKTSCTRLLCLVLSRTIELVQIFI